MDDEVVAGTGQTVIAIDDSEDRLIELSLENAALRAGGGENSAAIVKMARGLVSDEVSYDEAVKQVIALVKNKQKRVVVATGSGHGRGSFDVVNQRSFEANKSNRCWVKAHKGEIMRAMFEGKLK